ncbi:hypothetical protein [Apilactobacillus micheneri]|uniref:Uncharacterized protein n=1 Tax=Apilactobacillus micheneri TaxID=1899430 RepID=A0A9Q8ILR2_9LACO|nr:hypothetical protein [Apilactobacillus micheneri]TPR39363.1 hypothetical protein DY121_05495 [Apilactobacillus micheneri]TPR41565.1 hypothetical protein DY123_05455 [Apilactobacillus micheneri]TPR43468.1 hypothetical protein DY130_05490 [Apilactobacillus micheneri]TPR44377.1 hypothetical protein DY124_03790 [Apilactobacillus micheneri]TPR44585.1 hypothetical protein DY128_05490 [Apilactobacillus micheneri]
MKEQEIFKNVLKKYLSISFGIIFLLFLWEIFITETTRQLNLFNLLHEIFISTPFGITFNIILLLIFSFSYKNFKLSIQNSISRRKYFIIKCKLILLFSIISVCFNLLESFIDKFIFHIYADNFYSHQYDSYFRIDIFNQTSNFLITLFVMIFFILLLNTWGSFLSLFSAFWKFIFHIFFISMFLSCCLLLSDQVYYNIFSRFMVSINSSFILDFLFGFIDGINNKPASQINYKDIIIYNPTCIILFLIIISSILFLINYKLTKLKQVNR